MVTFQSDNLVIVCKNRQELLTFEESVLKHLECRIAWKAELFSGSKLFAKRKLPMWDLSQLSYRHAEQILKRFGIPDSQPVMTSLEAQTTITQLACDKIDESLYGRAVGSLMYLMDCTRLYNAFLDGGLFKHIAMAPERLWICLKQVLLGIRGTNSL